MARPITLFTGQWADLPFEEVAGLAAGGGDMRAWRLPVGEITSTSGEELKTTTTSRAAVRSSTGTDSPSSRYRIISRGRRSATIRSMPATATSFPTASGVTGTPRVSASGQPKK